MKVYKAEVIIVDHEDCGEESIRVLFESIKYINASVRKIEGRDIGEWSDDHPLNSRDTSEAPLKELFGE